MSNNAKKSFLKRKQRVRSSLKRKSTGRPRLVVNRSNNHFYAQIIDDSLGKTLASVSTLGENFTLDKKSNVEAARELGKILAKTAVDSKIDTVFFDRGGYIYHGKIKAFADSARENGLKF